MASISNGENLIKIERGVGGPILNEFKITNFTRTLDIVPYQTLDEFEGQGHWSKVKVAN